METHILLFILAGLLIAILVGSSILSNRREKSRVFSNTFSTRPQGTPLNTTPVSSESLETAMPPISQQLESEVSSVEIEQEVKNTLSEIKITLSGQTAEESFTAKTETAQPFEEMPTRVQPASQIDVTQSSQSPQASQSMQPVQQAEATQAAPEAPTNMLMLYIVAAEGLQFNGEVIAQALEHLGFQFGEYGIFHRHQHLGDNSTPVLFSVANMLQPGVFQLDKMDKFSTVGLVMFMYLPSVGNNNVANFKAMHKHAESLARLLGGFVLNDRRELFDNNSLLEYVNRLR